MRVGLIVRANQRGLGTQSYEAWRHLNHDATLLVVDNNRRWPEDRSLYPDAVVADYVPGHGLHYPVVKKFLDQVDVVFSIETLYDHEFTEWGVPCVVQGNPEFYRRENYGTEPTFTWPTPWLLDMLPPGDVIPVPVPNDKLLAPTEASDRLTILHPAGHAAAGDRNGTLLFCEALRSIRSDIKVRIVSQDGALGRPLQRVPRNIEVEQILSGVTDRWSMYDGVDLVVLPRRYGGLCLPAQEAFARGCAVMMTDCPPNDFWPTIPIQYARGRLQHTPLGRINTFSADARVIARLIDNLARDRPRLAAHKADGYQWAQTHTWSVLHPVYTRLLQAAAESQP